MIVTSVSNSGGIQAIGSKVALRKQHFHADMAYASRIIQASVKQGLDNLLGEGATHFSVRLSGNQHGYTISVIANDEIGSYIYHGTKPHTIGGSGEVLANISSEGAFGPVSGPIDHPGTKARKDEIDAEVQAALRRAIVFTK